MKKIYTLMLIIFPFITMAQITLTTTDLPSAGLLYVTASDSIYNAPVTAGGANQTWNYSTLLNNTQDTTGYVLAANTPYYAMFPGSNLASYSAAANSYTYYSTNSSGFYLNGVADGSGTGANLVLNPPLTFIPIPFTYQNQHSDYARYYVDSSIIRLIHRVESDFSADGYGILQLPNATYNNTLRIKVIEVTYDSVFADLTGMGNYILISATASQVVHYRWLRNGVASYLLGIEADSLGTTATSSQYLLNYSVGLNQIDENNSSFQLFPNPAQDRVHLILPPALHSATLKITDEQGRVIDTKLINDNDFWLDVSTYNKGWYVLNAYTEQQHYTSKLLVEGASK